MPKLMNTALTLTSLALIGATFSNLAPAAGTTRSLASAELVFEETGGAAAVEAERFYEQTLAGKRAWHIAWSKAAPG